LSAVGIDFEPLEPSVDLIFEPLEPDADFAFEPFEPRFESTDAARQIVDAFLGGAHLHDAQMFQAIIDTHQSCLSERRRSSAMLRG
jgi:hypothetical protein